MAEVTVKNYALNISEFLRDSHTSLKAAQTSEVYNMPSVDTEAAAVICLDGYIYWSHTSVRLIWPNI